jgi:hypothetical protein
MIHPPAPTLKFCCGGGFSEAESPTMFVDAHLALNVVRGTARTSAVLFSAGTMAAGIAAWRRWSAPAYRGLCVSHLVHYSAVVVYIQASRGTAFLSSAHFLIAAVFGVVMYTLMLRLGFTGERFRGLSVGIIGFAFTVAYGGRTARNWMFAPMLLLVLVSLIVYYRSRFLERRSRASAASA